MKCIQLKINIIFFILLFLGMGAVYAQQNFLKTFPSSATVKDNNKSEMGKTPILIDEKLLKCDNVIISMEGYEDVELNFDKKLKKGATFPLALIGCSSCCILLNNYSFDSKEPWTAELKLRESLKESHKYILVAIDTPRILIPEKKTIGKINGNSKSLSDKDITYVTGYLSNIDLRIINSVKNNYLDVSNYSNRKDVPNMYKPKIILTPVINDLSFEFKGKLLRDYHGPSTIQCTWKISTIDNPDKFLTSIPLNTNIYRTRDNYEILYSQLLYESARDLVEIDTLFDYLSKLEKAYLAKTKGEKIVIKSNNVNTEKSVKDMLKKSTEAVVTIENDDSFGSGFFISPDGYILTNCHVINNNKKPVVRINNRKVDAEVVKINSDYDLALIKITETGLKHLNIKNIISNDVGEEVWAIGTPLDKQLGQSVTKGIISGYREWNGVNFIQTDVSINVGNSGGPIINSDGEVVGIATLKASGRGIEGIGFCIPSNTIIEMLNIDLFSN